MGAERKKDVFIYWTEIEAWAGTQWIGIYRCLKPSFKGPCLIEMLKLEAQLPLSSMG